jgi:hypothetical protein
LLALAGVMALSPLWRRPVLIAGFGLSVGLVTVRIGDAVRLGRVGYGNQPTSWFSTVTILAGVVAGVAGLVASHGLRRARPHRSWAPVGPLAVTAGALAVWAAGHLIKPYHDYRGGIGEPGASGLVWLLVGAGVVAVVIGATRLEWQLGISLLCAVALIPVVDAVGDLVFRLAGRAGDETPTLGWWITEVAVVVVIGAVGSMLRPPPLGATRVSLAPLRRRLGARRRPV